MSEGRASTDAPNAEPPTMIASEGDVLDAFRDGSVIRTLIARTDPMSIDGAPAGCGVDAYGCFLERGDTMSGPPMDDAWRTIGAVCMNLIFTGNLCCGYQKGVYGCWTE